MFGIDVDKWISQKLSNQILPKVADKIPEWQKKAIEYAAKQERLEGEESIVVIVYPNKSQQLVIAICAVDKNMTPMRKLLEFKPDDLIPVLKDPKSMDSPELKELISKIGFGND